MQLTGLMHGAALLRHVDFPTAEVLGPDATEDEIAALIKRHGQEPAPGRYVKVRASQPPAASAITGG